MEHFDKKNSSYFDNMNGDLPDGFAWGDVKDGIYAKQEKKRKPFPFWWVSFGAIALIILAGGIYFYSSQENLSLDQSQTEIAVHEKSITKEIKKKIDASLDEKMIADNTETQTLTEIVLDKKSERVEDKPTFKTSERKNKLEEQKLFRTTAPNSKRTPEAISDKVNTDNLQLKDFPNDDLRSEEMDANSSNLSANSLDLPLEISNKILVNLPILAIENLLYGEVNTDLPIGSLLAADSYDDPDDKDEKSSQWMITAYGGTNLWTANYKGSDMLGQIRNDHTNQLLGFSANIGIRKSFKKQFFAGIDYGFVKWNSKFERESLQNVLVDTVIIISQSQNLLTGVGSDNYGEVTLPGTQRSYHKHYNNLTTFRIGAMIGYQIPISTKLNFEVSLGSGFVFNSDHDGKTALGEYNVFEYDERSPIFNPKGISISPGVSMRYDISDKFNLGLNLSYEKFLSNWANDGLTTKPSKSDVGFSLLYKL